MAKEDNKKYKYVVGIDLGTTFSCISIYNKDKTNIIPNLDGGRTTPSVVNFGSEILVGASAVRKSSIDPMNTIFFSKEFFG